MLKKFEVSNFKNFQKRICLDLSRVNNYPFNEDAIRNGILKTVLIYGDNGSGKTNLGYALFDIILHLTDKQRHLTNYRLYKNLTSIEEYVDFLYVFSFEEGEVKYKYTKNAPHVLLEEELWINDNQILSYNYRTNKGMTKLSGTETLNTDLSEKNISFLKYVYHNTLLNEDNVENRLLKKFYNYVEHMLWFSSLEKNEYQGYWVGGENVGEGIIKRGKIEEFQNFLKGLGISYQLAAKEVEGEYRIFCQYDKNLVEFFRIASRGTCSLALFFYWLIWLEEVSLVFIDEFDAFYHNNLAVAVIEELKKLPHTQAILTTHNTDIMTNDLLRPDCYLQIRSDGIKSFADSTPKELRRVHNIQKMYNAGAFDE